MTLGIEVILGGRTLITQDNCSKICLTLFLLVLSVLFGYVIGSRSLTTHPASQSIDTLHIYSNSIRIFE